MAALTKWIVLLRGVNVGGNNILKMQPFRTWLSDAGFERVSTYIQSGNVVLEARETEAAIIEADVANLIEAHAGFRPQIMALSLVAFDIAIAENPYQVGEADGKSVHFYFLAKPAPEADIAALTALKSNSERFKLTDKVFYLHAPDGVGRSKLAAKVERHIPTPMTGRNLRSVMKIRALAQPD